MCFFEHGLPLFFVVVRDPSLFLEVTPDLSVVAAYLWNWKGVVVVVIFTRVIVGAPVVIARLCVEDVVSSVMSIEGSTRVIIPSCDSGYVALRLPWSRWVVWDPSGYKFIDNMVGGWFLKL